MPGSTCGLAKRETLMGLHTNQVVLSIEPESAVPGVLSW